MRAPGTSHPKLLISGLGAPDVHSVGYYGRTSLGTWGVPRGVHRLLVCDKVCRGTLLTRKRTPLGPYCRPMPRVQVGS